MPVQPIGTLTPHQTRWAVRAQVSGKSGILKYKNAKGDGRRFTLTLRDEGGEIKATGFNEQVDRLFESLEEGGTYDISGGTIKPANPQYNRCANDYEMTFSAATLVEESAEAVVPTIEYDFVPIAGIVDAPVDSLVDVCAVVVRLGKSHEHLTKRKTTTTKRFATLRDETAEIELTIWGGHAPLEVGCVVACRGLKVGSYNERSLSSTFDSVIQTDPPVERAEVVKAAVASGGEVMRLTNNRGPRMTLADVALLGTGARPDWAEVKAVVTSLTRDGCSYVACPETNRKCTEQDDGRWLCEATQRDYDRSQVVRRYTLKMILNDDTGFQWVTAFDASASALLGLSAEELDALDAPGRSAVFVDKCFGEYMFQLKCRVEPYDDKETLKCHVDRADPVDYAAESKVLLSSIEELLKL
jgi:replication factor A1